MFGTENTSSLRAGPDPVSGMKAMLRERREGMTAPLLEFLQGWKSHWTHIPFLPGTHPHRALYFSWPDWIHPPLLIFLSSNAPLVHEGLSAQRLPSVPRHLIKSISTEVNLLCGLLLKCTHALFSSLGGCSSVGLLHS